MNEKRSKISLKGKDRIVLQGARAQMFEQAKTRAIFFVAVLILCYGMIAIRLIDLTIFRKSNTVSSAVINKRAEAIPKVIRRAEIVDRNGVLVASSLQMASAYIDPALVEEPKILAMKILGVLPELNYEVLVRKLNQDNRFAWIKRNITPKQKYALNSLGNPAIAFEDETHRIYPNGNLTAHITGYTDIDGRGIAGIENYFDEQLTTSEDPLQLSIDLRIQYIMHEELLASMEKFSAKSAIGMVMDVNTGEIISMVSLPDFDPNNVSKAKDVEKFNRATLGVFEMGSTFKLFSTAAALDSHLVNLATKFDVREPIEESGFTISDFHSKKRPLTVPEIFIYSSNIGTAKMARLLGNEGMESFFRALGFLNKAPIEIPERGMPIYPFPWRDINTLTVSFGHGIAVSPLHLIRAASALVNGGLMPQSTVIKLKDDGTESSDNIIEYSRVIKEDTSKKLRQLLELVVVGGTGSNAYVRGYNVGGKTGTAEKNIEGKYRDDALLSSFVGIFPINKPQYAVLVILDEPQPLKETRNSATGGWTAAPVVARVIEHMGAIYQIPPNRERTYKNIEKEMRRYLKDFKEGKQLAAAGTDR